MRIQHRRGTEGVVHCAVCGRTSRLRGSYIYDPHEYFRGGISYHKQHDEYWCSDCDESIWDTNSEFMDDDEEIEMEYDDEIN